MPDYLLVFALHQNPVLSMATVILERYVVSSIYNYTDYSVHYRMKAAKYTSGSDLKRVGKCSVMLCHADQSNNQDRSGG